MELTEHGSDLTLLTGRKHNGMLSILYFLKDMQLYANT